MTRPLLFKTIDDLTAMAQRKRDNAAELKLVRSELMHRTTSASIKLRERVEIWIANCKSDAENQKYYGA